MTVTVLHANDYEEGTRGNPLLREAKWEGNPEDVAAALAEGLYVAVATMEGTDPYAAYAATQNGPSPSWSREAPGGIAPIGPGVIESPHGPMGYRSSGSGDVFVVDGVVHVVGRSGIQRTDIRIAPDTEIRCIGGGSNVDALHGPRPVSPGR